jgi:CRP-like cAMP-binding protein/chromosome segregation ATPase/rhodanese-related sulfurtransferase
MSARPNQSNQDILKNFIPLNTLPSARLAEICNDCQIEECAKGTVLFEQGDDAKEFIYLVSGMISLYAGEMEMETIVTGSEAARFAIAHHIPRKVKAVTKSKVRMVRIPTYKLDIERQQDVRQTYLVDEVEDPGGDWMTTMLQSPVFQRLPASNLQKVMMQMEEVAFKAGEVVVNQGDEADFYYIIKSGDCELIRQSTEGAQPVKLAELHSCDAFGEDALLSGNPRNVTVRMKGSGQMLRLSKANFISLVKEPVLQYVSFEEGQQKVNEGANWLDVRVAESYEEGCIDGSVNIPFFSLRMKVSELRHDQLQILVCEKGRTSEAAAFLLLKFGFNALILKGGMEGVQKAAKPTPVKAIREAITKLEVVVADNNLSSTAGVDETKNEQLLAGAQNKILELEASCVQSNEKLNALELERHNLQQQHDQQAQLVAELQATSAAYAEQLKENNANNQRRDAELAAALSNEKDSNAVLVAELEKLNATEEKRAQLTQDLKRQLLGLNQQIIELTAKNDALLGETQSSAVLISELENKQAELDRVVHEAASSRNDLIVVQQELIEKTTQAAVKDESLVARQQELEQLKSELDNANSHGSELTRGFEQRLLQAKLQIVDLTNQKSALDKGIEDARSHANEVAQLNVNLQEEVEQLEQNSSASLSEKDEQIDALGTQLFEMRHRVVGIETAKEEVDSLLHEALNELEKVRCQGAEILAEGKAQAVSDQEKLGSELDALKQQLDEKENSFNTMAEGVKGLEEQLSSLDEASRNSDAGLQEKLAEIESFQTRLNEAELKLEQTQSDLAASISDNEQLKLSSTEQWSIAKAENKRLEEKLSQASDQLSSLWLEHDELKGQLSTAEQGANALREKEQGHFAAVANQKEINDRLQKDLDASNARLDVLVTDTAKLETELLEAYQRAERAEASLSAVTSGKASLEGELTERIAQVERNLAETSEIKNNVELQFKKSTDENAQLQQQLTELQNQLAHDVEGRQALQEDLKTARQEINLVVQNREAEESKLLQSSQQVIALEDELKLVQTQLSDVTEKLAIASDDNESLKQKASDAETVLLASTGDQQALLTSLGEVHKEAVSANELIINEFEFSKTALEQALNESQGALHASQAENEVVEHQVKELTDRLSAQSSEHESEEGRLKQQLLYVESQLKGSDEERKVIDADLIKLEEKLSAASSELEKTAFELSELRGSRSSGDEGLKQAQQRIDELTLALKAVSEEKERSITDLNQDSEGKLSLLAEQLSAAKVAAKGLLSEVAELSSLQDLGKRESGNLEERLQAANVEKDGLQRRVRELERATSSDNNSNDEARIRELEQQLDDSNSALMDLEIKIETLIVEVDVAPNEEDKNELKAVKYELNLVREQTEKDIQAIQMKLENSEKMNLALKKKILSMQALANQEVVAEEAPKKTRKGWWKK